MIDEDRTMQLFGYTSNELSPQSHKMIVCVCEDCGKYMVRKKYRYKDFCASCVCTGEKNAMYGRYGDTHPCYGINRCGEANPSFGRQCTALTRRRLSRANTGRKMSEEFKRAASIRMSGENHPRFGKPMSAHTRAALLAANLGSHPSEDTRQKISRATTGSANPAWKGGVTPIMKRVRQSPTYENWRKAVFERDDYTCQMCNKRGGDLEAHHIHPVRDHKNDLMMYDIGNGSTLCKQCHNETKGNEELFISWFKILQRGK